MNLDSQRQRRTQPKEEYFFGFPTFARIKWVIEVTGWWVEILWEFYCNHCQQPDHSEDTFGQLPCPIVKTFVLVISLNIRSYFLWISGHDFFEYQITISLNIRSWFLCNEILDHRSLGAPLVRSMQLSSSYALWSKLYFCPTDVFEYNFSEYNIMSFVYCDCILWLNKDIPYHMVNSLEY